MDDNERVLLEIVMDHLVVTEQLLEHYAGLAHAVQLQPRVATRLPGIEQPLTLQELRTSTQILLKRVRAILQQK